MIAFLKHSVAWILVALSLAAGLAVSKDKPSIFRGTYADSRYAEGDVYALDDRQHNALEALMKKQGYVTKDQVDAITNDAAWPLIGSQ